MPHNTVGSLLQSPELGKLAGAGWAEVCQLPEICQEQSPLFQDANDRGLGVFLFPFSGLQPMGTFEEQESGVVEERQSPLCRTPTPALCR